MKSASIKGRGFSFVELMVSMVLLSALLGIGVLGYSKMKRQQEASETTAVHREMSDFAKRLISKDVENAIYLNGATNSLAFFEGVRTYGLLRYPFTAVGVAASDGIQIITNNESLSNASFYEVVSITNDALAADRAQVVVQGDLRPTSTLSQDILVFTNGNAVELFLVYGSISYNSGTTRSTFEVYKDVPSSITAEISSSDNPKVYRAERVIYKVGDGAQTTGLYRGTAGPSGVFSLVLESVSQLNIKYVLPKLSTDSVAHQTDCAANNLTRWFAHETGPDMCDWNNVRSVQFDLTLLGQAKNGDSVESNFSFAITPLNYTILEN